MRFFISIALILFASATYAQESTSAANVDRESALASIKKWRGFEGGWEGEVRYTNAPKADWYKKRIPFRVTLKKDETKVFFQLDDKEWTEIGAAYRVYQPDELTVLIHAYGAGGVWTENNVVILTRRTEDAAEVYIQRVVNNWAGKPQEGEELVYGDTRAGKLSRQ